MRRGRRARPSVRGRPVWEAHAGAPSMLVADRVRKGTRSVVARLTGVPGKSGRAGWPTGRPRLGSVCRAEGQPGRARPPKRRSPLDRNRDGFCPWIPSLADRQDWCRDHASARAEVETGTAASRSRPIADRLPQGVEAVIAVSAHPPTPARYAVEWALASSSAGRARHPLRPVRAPFSGFSVPGGGFALTEEKVNTPQPLYRVKKQRLTGRAVPLLNPYRPSIHGLS